MTYQHIPVMLKEVLEYLNPKTDDHFIDCTLGGAGYTFALAEKVGKKGKVIGIDLDQLAIENAQQKIKEKKLNNIILVLDNFKNLKTIVTDNMAAETKFNGVVLDLGLSSAQLTDETRGFSFKGDRPLDMAFGSSEKSTEEIINNYSLEDLTRIFREYGEERQAYRIAKAIVNTRKANPIKTTTDLVTIIEKVIPARFRTRIHPATRVFQALRIETNDELNSLREVLPVATELLEPGGRLVVISFHSGEDRIVKRFFKSEDSLKILTKKPLTPSEVETGENPRARSAKLRSAEKLDNF